MNQEQLFEQIKAKKSFLCIGLDTDANKIPAWILKNNPTDPMFEFNKQIIDATHKYAVAYKPNFAFYEAQGTHGWFQLEKTVACLRREHPEILIIGDAKRGDIGNTSKLYAEMAFKKMGVDAITVAPYMGEDSVSPFLSYEGKWTIVLGLTSNSGADDFETLTVIDQRDNRNIEQLYKKVLRKASAWEASTIENTMFVVGATRAEMLADIRKIVPDHFLLIPGVGAQGGSLEEVAKYGLNSKCGLLVNNSRGIIYASTGDDFAEVATIKAAEMQQEMETYLVQAGII